MHVRNVLSISNFQGFFLEPKVESNTNCLKIIISIVHCPEPTSLQTHAFYTYIYKNS